MAKRNVASAISSAIQEAHQEIILKSLRDVAGEVTMGELIDSFAEHDFVDEFRAVTVCQFLAAKGTKPSSSKAGKKQSSAKPSKGKTRNTRTEEGREAIDADIRAALEGLGGSADASSIRAEVGGTPNQIRDSLKRLAAAKAVKTTGRRRSTVYHLK